MNIYTLHYYAVPIPWQHVEDLYKKDTGTEMGLHLVRKLKFEHIYLSSFSKMRVELVAQVCNCTLCTCYTESTCIYICMCILYNVMQVLSESVSKALAMTGGEDVSETAHYVSMVDRFFDCLNVNNFTSGKYKREVYKDPYRSPNDFRLKVNVHVCYIGA